MTSIDPEQERRRLQQVYAAKTDEELEQAAEQWSKLTDVAREILRAELLKRDLYSGQLEEPSAPGEEAEFRDLAEIRRYWNLLEAELAKGLLEAAGIEAFLFDDNMLRMDWFNANAIGGVKLRVDAQNAEEASRILDENASEFTALEDVASDEPDMPADDPST